MDRRPVLLALRALNLGDLLVTVPALRSLRRRYPEHELVLATSRALLPVATASRAVDRVLEHRGLAPPALPAPDVAVDLHGVLPDSVAALRATRPGRLVAFRCPAAGHDVGPETRDGEHEVARWCRLVASDGARPDPADLLLPRPQTLPLTEPTPASPLRPGVSIVHPGAAWGSKRWPAGRFAAVARALADAGHDVVITGSPAERRVTAEVAGQAGLTGRRLPVDLGGRTSLPALMALVADARVVVTGDTGTAHLATAYGRPSVVLFGPASPRLWGPPPRPWHRALWHGTAEHEVLVDEPDPALLQITVHEVLAAVADVLNHMVDISEARA